MNIIFFNSKTLVTNELIRVFKTLPGIQLIVVTIPYYPDPQQVEQIFETFHSHTPAIVFSINNAGYDIQGRLHDLIVESGSYQINWYHDFPFFDVIYKNRPYLLSTKKIDFISEPFYVDLLRSKGFTSYFLPLATDPFYFNTDDSRLFERDLAFVGNSSYGFIDSIASDETAGQIEQYGSLFLKVKTAYQNNPQFNVRQYLLNNSHEWQKDVTISAEKFVFAMEWLVGYTYRRDFFIDIANTYTNSFMIFGDPYWSKFINKNMVSADARYYDTLCHYYRTTKINLSVNRIHLYTSFTQRQFDTKACAAFLLTDKRSCNREFFKTEGNQKEIVEFESLAHCHELIQYYLTHEDEREKIAEAGRDRVLKNHTYKNRVQEIMSVAQRVWAI